MKTIFAQNINYTDSGYTQVSYNKPVSPDKSQFEVLLTKVGIISGTISAFFIAIIAYSIIRMFMIQKHEADHRDHAIAENIYKKAEEAKNPRWEVIENLILSPAEADWRVAIIEADVLLEESLIYSGFTGTGVGEMLTNSSPASFRTYQFAWDAHKVRNDIAHEGSSYKLSKEDAVRTLSMYRATLEEFGVV